MLSLAGKTDHCKEDAQPLAPGEPQQQQQLTRQALPPLAPMDSRALSPRVVQDHVRTSAVPSAPGSGEALTSAVPSYSSTLLRMTEVCLLCQTFLCLRNLSHVALPAPDHGPDTSAAKHVCK